MRIANLLKSGKQENQQKLWEIWTMHSNVFKYNRIKNKTLGWRILKQTAEVRVNDAAPMCRR